MQSLEAIAAGKPVEGYDDEIKRRINLWNSGPKEELPNANTDVPTILEKYKKTGSTADLLATVSYLSGRR